MSKYTTEVRFICESIAGNSESVGGNGIDSVIQRAIPHIFDFDFPIFKAEYRNVLATKILKHYYTREIGYETYGLWKFKLGVRLNEIMPYYNQLYESTLLEFNPLLDVDYTRTHERERNTEETEQSNHSVNVENDGDSTSDFSSDTTNAYSSNSQTETSANNTSNSKDLYSDTPQGTVGNLENGTYLTNARIKTENNNGENNATSNENGSASSNETGNNKTVSKTNINEVGENSTNNVVKDVDSFLETVKGKMSGTDYSEKLLKYRQTFLNIDLMVIEALSDLFMNLW